MSDLCVYAKFAYLFYKYLPHVMRVLLEATSGAQVLLQMVCHGVRRDRPKGMCAVVSHNKCSFCSSDLHDVKI